MTSYFAFVLGLLMAFGQGQGHAQTALQAAAECVAATPATLSGG